MAEIDHPVMPYEEGELGIGVQAERGTAVDATLWLPAGEKDCRVEREYSERNAAASNVGGSLSRQRRSGDMVVVKKDARISFALEPRFDHLLVLLPLAIGASQGGSEYVPGTDEGYFTVEDQEGAADGDGDSVRRYTDCKITTLTIESESNGKVRVTVEGVGGSTTMISGTAADWSAWATKPGFLHHTLSIDSGGEPSWLPDGQVYRLTLEINQSVEEEHFGNQVSRVIAPAGDFEVTGTLRIPWNGETRGIWDTIDDGTRFDLHGQWAGSGDETFKLELSCKAMGDPREAMGDEGRMCDISFEGVQTSGANALKAVFGS